MSSRTIAAATCLFALLVSAACRSPSVESVDDALLEVPTPVLTRLSPAVRDDLKRARATVDEQAAKRPIDRRGLGAAFGELGRLYHAYELFDSALPSYRNAETLLEADYRWPYYTGEIYRATDRLDEARDAFSRAVTLAPNDGPSRLALAKVLREQGRFTEAERLAEEILVRFPRSGGALLLLAEISGETERPEEAVRYYERLLEIQPQATRVFRPLAMAYRALGELERARELLERSGGSPVRVADPLLSEIRALGAGAKKFMNRGMTEFNRGDFEGAAAAFRQAMDADPELIPARLNLGSALAMLGKLDEAAVQFREVLRLDPTHAMTHFNLGTIAERGGDVATGREHYLEALAIDPGYRDPRFNLANSLRRTGECDSAVEHFARVRELDPRNGPARIGEVACLAESGRTDDAERRLSEALEALPGDRLVRLLAARLFAAAPQDDLRDGRRALQLAEGLDGEQRTPESLEAVAMALAELGRFPEAVETQRRAIETAETTGQTKGLARLRRRLVRFENGRASRNPAI